eukprot:TRINITY_DN1709_c0_g1_i1.p1 TRINITY_DN1709_c0_g1~~TRINITY_DN1709_c0_g1_i1.p1  ORF type:complete len:865 (+),score=146.62 TRINITY_DN1709_c0_g1_i1:86-2680(+)
MAPGVTIDENCNLNYGHRSSPRGRSTRWRRWLQRRSSAGNIVSRALTSPQARWSPELTAAAAPAESDVDVRRVVMECVLACTEQSHRRLVWRRWVCLTQLFMGTTARLKVYDELQVAVSPLLDKGKHGRPRSAVSPSLHGPVMERDGRAQVPSFQDFARQVTPVLLEEHELAPELAPLVGEDIPLYGLFSHVMPPEWAELRLLCSTHPIAVDFLGKLSARIKSAAYGTDLLQCVQSTVSEVPKQLAPLLSVVTQLVSFYVTYTTNTNLTFDRFSRSFATGGLLGLGPAVLVALAVSAGADRGGDGDDDFLDAAERACRMALSLGRALVGHHITLSPGAPGQSYVLQVHNISSGVLEVCLMHINECRDVCAPIEISMQLASRSFLVSGYPADLEALQDLLRSFAPLGFKFGIRFLNFSGPIQSSLNAPAVAGLIADWELIAFERSELALDVLSPVDGANLRHSDDLVGDLARILLQLPHCASKAHDALQFKAGCISFETTNVPNALGGHNLIVNHLLLTVPYMRCISQPYTFEHTRPSLDDLHPRNNTKECRRQVLLKCAMINEALAQLGSDKRCDLLASWLELDMLERRSANSPVLPGSSGPEYLVKSRTGAGCLLPSPSCQIGPGLLRQLAGDIDEVNYSSAIYNIERIEALGISLTEPSKLGRDCLQLLYESSGCALDPHLLWRCPNVIQFVEYWMIAFRLGQYSSPLTICESLTNFLGARSALGTPNCALDNCSPHGSRFGSQSSHGASHGRATPGRPTTPCPGPSLVGALPPAAHTRHPGAGSISAPAPAGSSAFVPSPPGLPPGRTTFARLRMQDVSASNSGKADSARTATDSPRTAARREWIQNRMRFFYSAASATSR